MEASWSAPRCPGPTDHLPPTSEPLASQCRVGGGRPGRGSGGVGLQQKQPPSNSAPQQPPDHSSLMLSFRRYRNHLPPPTPQTLTRAASPAGPWPRPVALSCSGPWHWQLPRLEDS